MAEIAVIHVAGPCLGGSQACSRCGYVFYSYDPDNPPAVLAGDPRDVRYWPEGAEVLVLGERGRGRYMAPVSALRPGRDMSDEVPCG